MGLRLVLFSKERATQPVLVLLQLGPKWPWTHTKQFAHAGATGRPPPALFPVKLSLAFRVLRLCCKASKIESLGVHLFLKGEWLASCGAASVTSSNFCSKLVWFLRTLVCSVDAENHSKLHRHTPGTSMSHSKSCRFVLSCVGRVFRYLLMVGHDPKTEPGSCYPAPLFSFFPKRLPGRRPPTAFVWIQKQAPRRAPIMHAPSSSLSFVQPSIISIIAMELERLALGQKGLPNPRIGSSHLKQVATELSKQALPSISPINTGPICLRPELRTLPIHL